MSNESDEGQGGQGSEGHVVGQVAGGVSEGLEAIADAVGEDEDVKEGLETAAAVAKAVQQGAGAARGIQGAASGIQSGDAGRAASGIGGAVGAAGSGVGTLLGGIGGALPEGEARQALNTASNVARTVGTVARGAGELLERGAELIESMGGGEQHDVRYHLEVQGSELYWAVHHVSLHERLGELSSCLVEASLPNDQAPEEPELLGKDGGLIIERGEERRSFRGVIRHAQMTRGENRTSIRLDLAPALWLAAETLDSRIYQGLDVPTLVEQVVDELVGSRQRTVRRELAESYPVHEYLVQHRESHWTFLKRICEEEGIFLYFDHDEEDREVLVLGDSNDNRPPVRADHDGVIDYESGGNQSAGREVATRATRDHRVGATDVVARSFDWTNPSLSVHHERTERGAWEGPRLEHYVHDHAVRHHEYDEGGGSYQSHTAERVTRMHTERLDVQRNLVTVVTTVVTAMPGHTFQLRGHDTLDGRYLILGATASGRAGAHTDGGGGEGGHGGSYQNTLTCIPAGVPYRPRQPERLRMPGPETATVVGPAGEEIHTDQHGRIKVQFHWDRQGQNDEHSSAWIRVNYGWAGPGWGQIFIPRIGMEVIVAFLGGDPDRPLAIGAVYNGQNRPPYALPDDKTKSTIKTNSSTGGGGFNELRFEDKAGSEEVFIHAQKDFNEVVEHCHTTHVKVDQTNTVDNDHTETIGHDQTLEVKGERRKTIHKPETTYVFDDRTECVHGVETLDLRMTRQTTIGEDEDLTILRDRKKLVKGTENQRVEGERTVVVTANDNLSVRNGGNRVTHIQDGEYRISVKGKYLLVQNGTEKVILDSDQVYVESKKHVHVVTGATHFDLKNDGKASITAPTQILLSCGPTKLELTTSGVAIEGPEVQAVAGESSLKLASSGATLKGSNVDILADMFATIKAILARIN
ncbi:MAG: type VI secretion system Vgr family protein [Sandaracinaceae bacterium]